MKESTQPTEEQQARYSAYHDEFMAKVKADARDLMQESRDLSAEGAMLHALALHTTATLFQLNERTVRIEVGRTDSKPKRGPRPLQYKCSHVACGQEFIHVTSCTHGYPDGVSCPRPECGCSAIPLSVWTEAVRRYHEINSKTEG